MILELDLPLSPQEAGVEQGALPLEEVEEVFLSLALMEEEEEQKKPGPQAEVVAQNHHHRSGCVWIFLALISGDCQDAFCTKDVVAAGRRNRQYVLIQSLYI